MGKSDAYLKTIGRILYSPRNYSSEVKPIAYRGFSENLWEASCQRESVSVNECQLTDVACPHLTYLRDCGFLVYIVIK